MMQISDRKIGRG